MTNFIDETRRWLNQERAWDTMAYASAGAAKPTPPPEPAPRAYIPTITASAEKTAALNALYEKYKGCVRCRLGPTRIKFVFGVGPASAQVMFIGEGPGYEEDRRGEPFVGKAGKLLDKILAAIHLSRESNAYIANIVKCHPMADPQTPEARGNDRAPTPDESETCSPILLQQIAIIQPRIIVTLGSPSTRMILKTKDGITQLRGKFFPFPVDAFYPRETPDAHDLFNESDAKEPSPLHLDADTREKLRRIQVLPTYHPAALLRNPNLKGDTWTDMKLLRDTLAKP